MAPPAELAPGQLDVASRVLTGDMACEFNQTVGVRPIDGQRGHFKLVFKKASYTLVPLETSTGAVRLEDRKAGVVWLQIATKSMLLNARTGNRMVDSCLHDDQRHAVAPAGSSLGIEAPLTAGGGDTAAPAVASAQLPADALIPRQLLFGAPPLAGGSIALAGPPAPTSRLAITTRDGLVLPATLTLPKGSDADGDGRPEQALPMVLLVHGQPSAGEHDADDATRQWLANRGYAVLGVDSHGATASGTTDVGAARRKLHEDLLDAVEWAAGNGVARRDKVALMGGSDGRPAAWVGLTMTPMVYACGVAAGSGVGSAATPQTGRGPIERLLPSDVERIERPLLIGQGAQDPRAELADSDRIVAALQARRIPVSYVLYPDEGHGFAQPANRISFHAVVEQFLASCLGGRAQAVGDDFKGSSIQVLAGVEAVPAVQGGVPPPPGR